MIRFLWSVVFFGIVSMSFIINLHACFSVSSEFKTKPLQALDDDLQREFAKPNKWKLTFFVMQ